MKTDLIGCLVTGLLAMLVYAVIVTVTFTLYSIFF
jgi:hypothetical protein